MKIVLKTAVAGALALAAAAANALGIPALNNSDLILVVQNTTTQATYELDTGISINSLMGSGAGTLVSGAVLNSTAFAGINAAIGNSTTLASFLAANPLSGDGWTIEGGQYAGTTATTVAGTQTRTPGKGFAIFSSFLGTTTPSNVGGFTVSGMNLFLNGLNGDVNTGGLLPLQTATESTAGSYSAGAASKYNLFGTTDLQAPGTSSILFGLTGNGSAGQVQSYELGTVAFGANGLVFTANGGGIQTPLPAAAWLFGSGLLGLVGVRRRKASV